MTNITETEALNKVAAYCSTAEHCRAEISEKLQRWGLPYDVIDRILKRLVDEKYIDYGNRKSGKNYLKQNDKRQIQQL